MTYKISLVYIDIVFLSSSEWETNILAAAAAAARMGWSWGGRDKKRVGFTEHRLFKNTLKPRAKMVSVLFDLRQFCSSTYIGEPFLQPKVMDPEHTPPPIVAAVLRTLKNF